MILKPGDVIGSYQIGEEVGRGGRAVVFRAWQRTTGRWVALKVLRRRDPDVLEDFRREARLTANIGHSRVRKVYDVGRTPSGYPFLVVQFVDLSMRRLLRACEEQGRTFSRQEVVSLLRPVAEVLDYIHQRGLVHLDIKPENILVFKDGQAVLADFGSARRIGSTTHEGTPKYFSPEQAAGDRPVSPQSDIYSLAVVAYEMLTGRPPFVGERDIILVRQHLEDAPPPLRQVNASVPQELETVVAGALSKDPSRRPGTARAFIDELEQAEEDRSERIPFPPWGDGSWRPWMWIPVGMAPVILMVGGFFLVRSCASPPGPGVTPTSSTTARPAVTSTVVPSRTATATATVTATATPTATIERTSTPRPTSTPTPTRPPATPTPTGPAITPTAPPSNEDAGAVGNTVASHLLGLNAVFEWFGGWA